jgi:hypothetical protein
MYSLDIEIEELPLVTQLDGSRWGVVTVIARVDYDRRGEWSLRRVGLPAVIGDKIMWLERVPGTLGGMLFEQVYKHQSDYISEEVLKDLGGDVKVTDPNEEHRLTKRELV